MIRFVSYILIFLSTLMTVGIEASPVEALKTKRATKKSHKNKKSKHKENNEETEEKKETEERIEKELEWFNIGFKLSSLALNVITDTLSKKYIFLALALKTIYLSFPTPPPERV